MKYKNWFPTYRYTRSTPLNTSDPSVLIASGFFPEASAPPNVELRSVFLGSSPGQKTDKTNSFLTFRLEGSRNGVHYTRTFSLAVGQDVVLDAESLESLNVYLLAYGGVDDVLIQAAGSDAPPVSASIRQLLYVQTWGAGPLAIEPVPAGAKEVVAYTAAPGFEWIMYPAGTPVALSAPLGVGDRAEVSGTHYRGSPGATVVWSLAP